MDLARFFESTLTDCDAGIAVRMLAIPVESLAPHARSGIFDWPDLLGIREIARLTSPGEVASTLASLGVAAGAVDRDAASGLAGEAVLQEFPVGSARVACLRELYAAAHGEFAPRTVLGAVGDNMLLLFASRDLIVLFSTAAEFSAALAGGLAVRVREAMGLDGRRFRSTGPASVSS